MPEDALLDGGRPLYQKLGARIDLDEDRSFGRKAVSFFYSTGFSENTLPRNNMTGWKVHHEWRCISYWTWGFSNVMLVFRGVVFYTSSICWCFLLSSFDWTMSGSLFMYVHVKKVLPHAFLDVDTLFSSNFLKHIWNLGGSLISGGDIKVFVPFPNP